MDSIFQSDLKTSITFKRFFFKISLVLGIDTKKSATTSELTPQEFKQWQDFFNLTHYQEKTPEGKKPVSLEVILKTHHR